MAGLDPAIHLLRKKHYTKNLDPRVISASTRVFDALLPAGDAYGTGSIQLARFYSPSRAIIGAA
jgi:hypothetical protein